MTRPVALFMPTFSGGGAERMMVNLAGALVADGRPVELVVARGHGPYADKARATAPVTDLGVSRVWQAVRPLSRWLNERRPSVLLVTLEHATIVAGLAKRLAAVPVPLIVREANATAEVFAHVPMFRRTIEVPLLRWAYRQADRLVSVSAGAARDLEAWLSLPSGAVDVVYNPVVTSDLAALARERPGHPWFDDDGPPVILGVGRLTAQKDFATLLRAVAIVRRDRPVRLVLAGEGELRSDLEGQAAALGLSEVVAFAGFVANPFALMARAAVVALSSRFEGLPGVLVQALAVGAPVVATDCPHGPREILADGRWGPLVSVGNAESLAAALRGTLARRPDPAPPEAVAAFTRDAAFAKYRAVLDGVLA